MHSLVKNVLLLNFTADLSFELTMNVNVSDLYHVHHERFRPSIVPLTVSKRSCNVSERLETKELFDV